jgi:ABC-type transporter Mla maintaining outer membrane lipid asymmetry ATPase subunit MlaF
LARTLLTGPETVLMDEPTASVDPALRLDLEAEARSLIGLGVSVVWVTHDLDQMRRLADYVLVLAQGAVRFEGTQTSLDSSPDPRVWAFLKGERHAR